MTLRTRITLILTAWAATLSGQTTQGVISGRLLDSISGDPIGAATIEYSSASSGTAQSGADGYYYLPLLSPGTYRVRVSATNFQSQELEELELPVAGRIELDFKLRPLSDVWEAGEFQSVFLPGSKTVVAFFGPDVDSSKTGSFDSQGGRVGAMEASVSQVINSAEINDVPLQGRDVYNMLVTQPGVTSDSATARGLGLSANGQRPSASNFMLDGLENNNYLITGPLVTVAPEVIQEYRLSTSNFSAEYGRTSGYLANAITRSGSNNFHGVAYFYLINDDLNGNGFQENLAGIKRAPNKQVQPGFVVGGPILRNRLFFSSSYEYFRNKSLDDPVPYIFPTTSFLSPNGFAGPNSLSRQLLTLYPAPSVTAPGLTGTLKIAQPVEIDRTLALQRFDYTSSKDRVMLRMMASLLEQPDFIWSPYAAFTSPLHENTFSIGVADTHTIRPNLINEARAAFSDDDLHWDRALSQIPTLASEDGTTLPGSPAFYAYKNRNASTELLDNIIWTGGRHQITAGAGVLLRGSNGFLTAGTGGQYLFSNILTFALDQPAFFRASVDRATLPALQLPNTNRDYRYQQYFGFVQDSFKLTSRLNVNYGIRYELFGAPNNVGGTKDLLVTAGQGTSLAQQLTGSTLQPGSHPFGTDHNDWAPRIGAAYDLFGNAKTLLRGGFGIYYDRPFDNLWENVRNNNFVLPLFSLAGKTNYLAPVATVLAAQNPAAAASDFPDLTYIQPGLKNGRVLSYFAGVEHRFSPQFTFELNGLGSYGDQLITTDIVNRDFSTLNGRYNPALPEMAYRAGQGFSNYNALSSVVRYHSRRGMAQVTYTWSHTIDNQSEPLQGDFFNLDFTTSATTPSGSSGRATFTEQFNPNADRGSSDFDQRQNLVLVGYWNVPGLLAGSKAGYVFRDWMVSGLAAFRSGFPYTVLGTSQVIAGQGEILENRPNLVNPSGVNTSQTVPGGVLLLNSAAFANAAPSTLGNLGRNSLTGPGFYNLDLSLARSFAVTESRRFTLRASAFNLLNHANLNNPDTQLGSPTFGVASFGRQGVQSGFPAVTPLNETPRQIQLSLKFEF